MAIEEVIDWTILARENVAVHTPGPRGREAERILQSFQDIQGAIARWRVALDAGSGPFIGRHADVITTPYTVADATNVLVDDDAIGGPAAVILSPISAGNREYTVKKLGTTGAVTISGDAPIDGEASITLLFQYESVRLYMDGANWNIL